MSRALRLADLPPVLRNHIQVDPITHCWIWTGCVSGSNRRPKCDVKIAGKRESLPYRAVAILASGGPPLPHMQACHACGQRLCCRYAPEHVRWGGSGDNGHDSRRLGEFAGVRNPRHHAYHREATA